MAVPAEIRTVPRPVNTIVDEQWNQQPEASKTKRPRGRPRKDAKPSVGLL